MRKFNNSFRLYLNRKQENFVIFVAKKGKIPLTNYSFV